METHEGPIRQTNPSSVQVGDADNNCAATPQVTLGDELMNLVAGLFLEAIPAGDDGLLGLDDGNMGLGGLSKPGEKIECHSGHAGLEHDHQPAQVEDIRCPVVGSATSPRPAHLTSRLTLLVGMTVFLF